MIKPQIYLLNVIALKFWMEKNRFHCIFNNLHNKFHGPVGFYFDEKSYNIGINRSHAIFMLIICEFVYILIYMFIGYKGKYVRKYEFHQDLGRRKYNN